MTGKPRQPTELSPPAHDEAADAQMAMLYGLPGHLIRRAQQVAVAIFLEEVGKLDVTPVQFGAMTAIAAHPGIDATHVSALIAFDRSTMGDVLDRLESKGWIERRPSPQDKRVKSLWLTEAGRELYERCRPAVLHTQERLLAPLQPSERERFVAVMRQLVGLHTGGDRYKG